MSDFRDFDWSEIIFDLKRARMSHGEICVALKNAVSESGVRSYMAGGQPGHWRGEMLLDLWSARTGKPRAEAPTRAAPYRHVGARRPVQRQASMAVALDDLETLARRYGVGGRQLFDAIQRAAAKSTKTRPPVDTRTLPLPGVEVIEEKA